MLNTNAASAEPTTLTQQYQTARALRVQGQHLQAVKVLRALLRTDPEHPDALLDLGGLMMLLGRPEVARQCFVRLLRLQPQHSPALFNLGQVLEDLGQSEPALAAYQAALAAEPDATRVLYHQEFLRLSLCDWQGYDERTAHLALRLTQHARQPDAAALAPLRLLSFAMPLAVHRALARQWADSVAQTHRPVSVLPTVAAGLPQRIRIGYLSADFRAHAMGGLIHGLFAHHDRARRETP